MGSPDFVKQFPMFSQLLHQFGISAEFNVPAQEEWLVDVEENAFPTLHQAAVSSVVFLLSLALAGIGFLPMFFNEERRAAHDILSGTILIREI